jgi:UDP-N-acetylglucosamine 2-epimerase
LPFLDLAGVQGEWGGLERFLKKTGVAAVIRSSSENVLGGNVEELAAAAAREVGVPVFVVEDFPGNYWTQPAERLDGLFVEDESLVDLHRSHGVSWNIIHITGNPRYNALLRLDRESCRAETRKALGLPECRVMLWAGQPDGDNSYQALARLLERFDGRQVTLLFRAHPRDRAYATGKYHALLAKASMNVLDVSLHPDALGLCCAADLVVTQFSSAGVEASHLGTPALFVLFDDLGKEYLRSFKGYDSLPWCAGGCSFLVDQEEEVAGVMERALFDEAARKQVRARFQRRFGAKRDSAQAIAAQIRTVVGNGTRQQPRPESR